MEDVKKPSTIYVSKPEQQHMLHLFFPIKKGIIESGINEIATSFLEGLFPPIYPKPVPVSGPDMRVSTGVHFTFFYLLRAGQKPPLLGPSYQLDSNKDLLVIQAIYDDEFAPYIASFVQQPSVAAGLNLVLMVLDESNIDGIDEFGPNSAYYILKNGGVVKNPDAFNALLENYNFAASSNVSIPTSLIPSSNNNPVFGATFPGLTVGKILQYYPDANEKWPFDPKPNIYFEK